MAPGELAARVAEMTWYHTIEMAPGVVTPGYYDLRPVVDKMPWPDVKGKRCLDVGTFDGFLAFELERRGASEVVAIDLDSYEELDWLPDRRAAGPAKLAEVIGPRGAGFRLAAEALGSRATRLGMNVYDLEPGRVGTFDVVVCGSLLLHLRDPLRALEAIRSVCSGTFLSAEAIELGLSVLHRKKPLIVMRGAQDVWTTANAAGHRRMLFSTGFKIERVSPRYAVPYGVTGARSRGTGTKGTLRSGMRSIASRLLAGGDGVPHQALLARPRVSTAALQ